MTILRFNWIALIFIYIGAVVLGFLYSTTLGWCISLYALCSILYLLLNITKIKDEKNKGNI